MDGFLFVLTLFAALGCGVVAGVFFAFSAFVMKALDRSAGPAGRRGHAGDQRGGANPRLHGGPLRNGPGMRRVNPLRRSSCGMSHPPFICWSAVRLYLICAIGPTVVYHVPRNEALARVEPRGVEAERSLVELPRGLDRVEPPAVRRGPRRICRTNHRTQFSLVDDPARHRGGTTCRAHPPNP